MPYINLTKYYKRFTKKYKFFLIFEIPYHLLRYYNFININYKLSNLLFNSTKKILSLKEKFINVNFILNGAVEHQLYIQIKLIKNIFQLSLTKIFITS